MSAAIRAYQVLYIHNQQYPINTQQKYFPNHYVYLKRL
jgi:hypothetical protein